MQVLGAGGIAEIQPKCPFSLHPRKEIATKLTKRRNISNFRWEFVGRRRGVRLCCLCRCNCGDNQYHYNKIIGRLQASSQ